MECQVKKEIFKSILFFTVFFSVNSQAAMNGSHVVQVNPNEGRLVPEWRSEFNPLARHLNTKQDESYVFLLSFAPQKTVSFHNGQSLKNSMIALRGSEAGSVGHTMVAWSCSNGRRITSRGLTGFSGERSTQVKDLRDRGFGLLGALAIYTDGYLQDANTPALNYKFRQVQEGKFQMKWIGVKVSNSACNNVRAFRNRFKDSGAYRNFGFNLNPGALEGAGCSSYARHLLYQAGILNSTAPYWTRSLVVPYALVANPARVATTDNPNMGLMTPRTRFKFSLNQLQSTPVTSADLLLRSWEFNQAGFDLNITDTELIYYTILQAERLVSSGGQGSFPRNISTRFRRVRQTEGGASVNATIDQRLDGNTAAIYNSLRNNRLDAVNYSHSMINGVTGLLIEGDLK